MHAMSHSVTPLVGGLECGSVFCGTAEYASYEKLQLCSAAKLYLPVSLLFDSSLLPSQDYLCVCVCVGSLT